MTEVLIERFTTSLPASHPSAADDPGRFDRIAGRFADRLGAALAAVPFGEGWWCLRRVGLQLPVAATDSDLEVESRWAALIDAAVREVLDSSGGDGVVCYRTRQQALADLVDRLAADDAGRVWAWRQVGLLLDTDPDPTGAPGGAARAVLRRAAQTSPAGAAAAGAAVLAVIADRGWAPVVRLLGEAGLAEVTGQLEQNTAGPRVTAGDARDPEAADRLQARLDTVLAASALAAAWRRTALRPTTGLLDAVALLVLAEADPALLGGPRTTLAVRLLADRLGHDPGPREPGLGRLVPASELSHRRDLGVPPEPERSDRFARDPARSPTDLPTAAEATPADGDRGRRTHEPDPAVLDGLPRTAPADRGLAVGDPERARTARTGRGYEPAGGLGPTGPSDARRAPARTGPERNDEADEGDLPPSRPETAWGGLVFLLNTAGTAGLPDALAGDLFPGRTSRWVLHQLAQQLLPLSPHDPAALAFAGLGPQAVPPFGLACTPAESAALTGLAERWAAVTLDRLAAVDDDPWDLVRLTLRHGWVQADPGWVELHLDLEETSLPVRKAGLDLDPGFVRFLGVVVRVVYV